MTSYAGFVSGFLYVSAFLGWLIGLFKATPFLIPILDVLSDSCPIEGSVTLALLC